MIIYLALENLTFWRYNVFIGQYIPLAHVLNNDYHIMVANTVLTIQLYISIPGMQTYISTSNTTFILLICYFLHFLFCAKQACWVSKQTVWQSHTTFRSSLFLPLVWADAFNKHSLIFWLLLGSHVVLLLTCTALCYFIFNISWINILTIDSLMQLGYVASVLYWKHISYFLSR